ncbi:GRAS family protein RAD1-like [Apium graveolens]|uniref:GRAS family protein RAD1-like n=1 Tax=Apium graveolens TaxID=4045 RepID=UPI003D79BA92
MSSNIASYQMLEEELEAMNTWLSFPSPKSLNQDSAIRQFCPARIEQEQEECEEETYTLDEAELWLSSDGISAEMQAYEEELFVDSFFNTECHTNEHLNNKQEPFEQFHDDHENFTMTVDYDYIPMMVEEDELVMSNSCEDPGLIAEDTPDAVEEVCHGVDQGLHLVHLLLACAEAVGCRDIQHAQTTLSQIWSHVSPWGDSLQRVSYCFAMGLESRLSLLNYVKANGILTNGLGDQSLITRDEKLEAFFLLHQTTPYINFGFMAANDAICQAAEGKDFLHIVDLGMEHTLQWPYLLRTLASRLGGPPKLIRITGISEHNVKDNQMQGTIVEAESLGISVEFCRIDEAVTPSLLTKENLNLKEGEALIVNSIMQLHKYVKESRGSLKIILQAIKKLEPALLTVVEQDASLNGPFFLGRFLESLHYYSAVFDSLESSLPRDSIERMKIEKLYFAEEIRNIVAYEGADRIQRYDRADQWRRQLSRAGFQSVGIKCTNQTSSTVSLYESDGYTLATEKNCLLLGWKGRPIMLASAWKTHSVSSS